MDRSLFGCDLHFHKLTQDPVHTNGNAKAGQWNARPAEVPNGRVGGDPVARGIVEQWITPQVAIAFLDAVGMQADPVRPSCAKSGVIGLNTRTPDLAIIRTDHQL